MFSSISCGLVLILSNDFYSLTFFERYNVTYSEKISYILTLNKRMHNLKIFSGFLNIIFEISILKIKNIFH